MPFKLLRNRISRPALYVCIGVLFFGAMLLAYAGRSYVWVAIDWVNQENVDIPSATISVRDQGAGSPAVIIIIGMATNKNDYRPLQSAIAKYTRVLSYDRPGLGASGSNSEPRTLDVFAKDLDELLQVKEIPPPYILVGHSMGGLFIRYYADLHPDDVAGLVFLDTSHEGWFQYIRSSWPADDQQKYFAFWDDSNPKYVGVRREEKSAFEENFNMVSGLKIDEDMPVLMFTGGRHHHFRKDNAQDFEADRKAWIGLHEDLLVGVKDAKHIVHLELDHWLHYPVRDEIADEIAKMIELENKENQ